MYRFLERVWLVALSLILVIAFSVSRSDIASAVSNPEGKDYDVLVRYAYIRTDPYLWSEEEDAFYRKMIASGDLDTRSSWRQTLPAYKGSFQEFFRPDVNDVHIYNKYFIIDEFTNKNGDKSVDYVVFKGKGDYQQDEEHISLNLRRSPMENIYGADDRFVSPVIIDESSMDDCGLRMYTVLRIMVDRASP